MTAKTSLRRLLQALFSEVSEALDHRTLAQDRRGEARESLLSAFVVLGAPSRTVRIGHLVRWSRRLDALLTTPVQDLPDPWPLQQQIERRLAGPRFPLVARLEALERAAAGLARRTELMVEMAERTARRLGREVPEMSQPRSGGRETLELVWGEEE